MCIRDSPWTWLQIAKLESHFGNKEGALEAVKQGLDLVPDDYEFITLQREITEGDVYKRQEVDGAVVSWGNLEIDNSKLTEDQKEVLKYFDSDYFMINNYDCLLYTSRCV